MGDWLLISIHAVALPIPVVRSEFRVLACSYILEMRGLNSNTNSEEADDNKL